MSFANDDEPPSYESCLCDVNEELDFSTSPGHDRFHELGAPEVVDSRPSPADVPTDTKSTPNVLPTISEPIPEPPPIRRETHPNINTPTKYPHALLSLFSVGQAPSNSQPYYYDALLVDKQYPSDTLCHLADGLFRQLTASEFLDPFALARADDPYVQNAVLAPQMLFRFTRFLTLAGIPFTRTAASNIPILNRDSFIHFLVFEMRANPEHSYAIWQTRLRHYPLRDKNTRVPLALIHRSAFPERAVDAVLTNVHDVWRVIVGALGKRQHNVHDNQPVGGLRSQRIAMLASALHPEGTSSQRGSGNIPEGTGRKVGCRFNRCVRKRWMLDTA